MKGLLVALTFGTAMAVIFWFYFAPHLSSGLHTVTIPGGIQSAPAEALSPAAKALLTVYVGIGSTVTFALTALIFSRKP